MIRTWPGQTKEEWIKEYRRNQALSPEERERELDEYVKEMNAEWESYKQKNESSKPQSSQNPFENCDHPNSLENSEATIVWIVAMGASILFKGGWALCILETIIWWKYITRHKRKK